MKMHLNRMSPGITDMIRMDHTHVFAVFHRFKHSTSHARKRALMRTVIHHVADEESVLLPEAERRMSPERLNELGAEMTKRRIELVRPHARELASTSVQSFPVMSMLAATSALTLGAWLLRRNGTHRTPPRRAWSIP